MRIGQVDGEQMDVGRPVGGGEVEVPVGDTGRDLARALYGAGGRRAREGGAGQRAEDGELGENGGEPGPGADPEPPTGSDPEPGSGPEMPVTRHEYPLGTGGCLAVRTHVLTYRQLTGSSQE